MSYFDDAIEYLLSPNNEGGYSNNSHDHGGETNFGISTPFYNSLPTSELLKHKLLKEWTIEDAKFIYKKYIWDNSPCEKIKDRKIAIKLFDAIVNMGLRKACLLLQRACNKPIDKIDHLIEDGVLGKKSLEQINFLPPVFILKNYCDELFYYYENIVKHDPSQKVFLVGWQKRALKIPL